MLSHDSVDHPSAPFTHASSHGLRATTHWLAAADFARRHPAIDLDANVLYVDDGRILTSAGAAAGFDLCIHMVRRDLGADLAASVARLAVMPLERAGGAGAIHRTRASIGSAARRFEMRSGSVRGASASSHVSADLLGGGRWIIDLDPFGRWRMKRLHF
jgi:hypothetical protein